MNAWYHTLRTARSGRTMKPVADEKKKTSGMLKAVTNHARKATDELRCKSVGPYGMRCVKFPGHEKSHLDRDGVEWSDQ
jgi:hypothetical protein